MAYTHPQLGYAKRWWNSLNPIAKGTIQWKHNVTNVNDKTIEMMYKKFHKF